MRKKTRPPFVLFFLFLVIAAIMVHTVVSLQAKNQRTSSVLDTQVDDIVHTVKHHVLSYSAALYGARALFTVNPNISASQWNTYVEGLDTFRNFEGMGAMAVIKRVRAADSKQFLVNLHHEMTAYASNIPDFSTGFVPTKKEYYFVAYAEPIARAGVGIGFDFNSEPKRTDVLTRAILSNAPVASARLNSVGSGAPTFIVSIPIYKVGMVANTSEERLAAATGLINIGVRSDDFFKEIIQAVRPVITHRVVIFDGDQRTEGSMVYDSQGTYTLPSQSLLTQAREEKISFFSRTWSVLILTE